MGRSVKIERSKRPGKKFTAIFDVNGRKKTVNFGSAGMDDYTKTGDSAQRSRYRSRHAKDLRTGDPTRAGFLSYYLLWGPSKSMQANLRSYKRKFNFN
jgi:hypothetical protein